MEGTRKSKYKRRRVRLSRYMACCWGCIIPHSITCKNSFTHDYAVKELVDSGWRWDEGWLCPVCRIEKGNNKELSLAFEKVVDKKIAQLEKEDKNISLKVKDEIAKNLIRWDNRKK